MEKTKVVLVVQQDLMYDIFGKKCKIWEETYIKGAMCGIQKTLLLATPVDMTGTYHKCATNAINWIQCHDKLTAKLLPFCHQRLKILLQQTLCDVNKHPDDEYINV